MNISCKDHTSVNITWEMKQNQSLVAKWLRWWVNLGVTPPPSEFEVVGSNPTAGMSKLGFFYPGKKFQWFSLAENAFLFILHPIRSLCDLFVAMCYCCKINKVYSFF